MDLKDLERLVKLCHKHAISHIKTSDIELTIDLHKAPQRTIRGRKPSTVDEALSQEAEVTEEDILFWSSGSEPTEN